jgi:hypothetical protein
MHFYLYFLAQVAKLYGKTGKKSKENGHPPAKVNGRLS